MQLVLDLQIYSVATAALESKALMLLPTMFSILALLLELLLYHQLKLQSLLYLQFEYLQTVHHLLHRLLQTKFVRKKQQQLNKTARTVKIPFQLHLSVLILKAKLSNNELQSYLLLKREWHLLRCLVL